MNEIRSIRGMHDLFGIQKKIWDLVESSIRKVLNNFGYEEIRFPVLENIDVFKRTVGSETDIVEKQMYVIKTSDSETLVLRPEGTASFMRAVVEHGLYRKSGIQRYFYNLPMYRYERPQKGRLREFFQIGVEVINSPFPEIDAEVIYLLNEILLKLGINDFSIEINSVGCPQCRGNYSKLLLHFLKEKSETLCPQCRNRLSRSPLRVLDCKLENCKKTISDAPIIIDSICENCKKHHENLKLRLRSVGIDFLENSRIVRGLDYYLRTAFEFTTTLLGSQNAIGGGGRYDKLSCYFGVDEIPAVGWALGMERLIMLLESYGKILIPTSNPFCYVIALGNRAFDHIWPITLKLKSQGIFLDPCEGGEVKLKNQLKKAAQNNFKYCLIIGDNELNSGKAILKNLEKFSQEEISLSDIEAELIRRHQSET